MADPTSADPSVPPPAPEPPQGDPVAAAAAVPLIVDLAAPPISVELSAPPIPELSAAALPVDLSAPAIPVETAAAAAAMPPPTAQAKQARGKSPRFLVALVALAITGTGSLMLVASAMRAPAETGTTAPAATIAGTAAAAPAPVAVEPNLDPVESVPTPKWAASRNSRKVGYGANMVFELAADADIEVWRKRVRPVLTVRCAPKAAEVFVVTDSPASIEGNSNRHTVTMSFDGRDAIEQKWEHSIDHDALFAPDGRAMVRRIAAAKDLTFSFSPFNAPQATVTFSVEGFADQQKNAVRMCGL